MPLVLNCMDVQRYSFHLLPVLLPSVCLIFLHWFSALIYFSLVLPVSRESRFCLNFFDLLPVCFLFPDTFSGTQLIQISRRLPHLESGALLLATKVSYHLVPFNTVHQITTQLFSDQSITTVSLSPSSPSFLWHQFCSSTPLVIPAYGFLKTSYTDAASCNSPTLSLVYKDSLDTYSSPCSRWQSWKVLLNSSQTPQFVLLIPAFISLSSRPTNTKTVFQAFFSSLHWTASPSYLLLSLVSWVLLILICFLVYVQVSW